MTLADADADADLESAWTWLYEAVVSYQTHMKEFYSALGRLMVIRDSSPHETALIDSLQAVVEALQKEMVGKNEQLVQARAHYDRLVTRRGDAPQRRLYGNGGAHPGVPD